MNTNLNNYLCDSSLHDEKVRVVDIQLDWSEKVLHTIILHVGAVYEILVFSSHDNLRMQDISVQVHLN